MQRRFGAASIAVTVKGWHISLKGDRDAPLWPQAVLREIVSVRVGLVVRQSLTAWDIADLQGPCPRACRVGALSIAYCGAERELPWLGLRCEDSTKACTVDFEQVQFKKIHERALADGTEIG